MVVTVHQRVAKRHPDISIDDVMYAWEHAVDRALRVDSPNFPEYVCIGYDENGRAIEMVGTQTEDGWLIYHAMTPPSKKTVRELDQAKRRLI